MSNLQGRTHRIVKPGQLSMFFCHNFRLCLLPHRRWQEVGRVRRWRPGFHISHITDDIYNKVCVFILKPDRPPCGVCDSDLVPCSSVCGDRSAARKKDSLFRLPLLLCSVFELFPVRYISVHDIGKECL